MKKINRISIYFILLSKVIQIMIMSSETQFNCIYRHILDFLFLSSCLCLFDKTRQNFIIIIIFRLLDYVPDRNNDIQIDRILIIK